MPPRSFAVLSGSFDSPEASDSPSNIPTRRPSIHRHYNPYTQTHQSAQTNEVQMDRRPTPRLSEVTNLRQRIVDLHSRVQHIHNATRDPREEEEPVQAQYPRTSQLSLAGTPFTNPLQRHRLRRQREDDTFGTVQEAVDRLNEATSDLTSILDEPLPRIATADEHVASLLADTTYLGRRFKRRKLDEDPADFGAAPSYGHFGQVVPGRLKMLLRSCDGGLLPHREEHHSHRQYWPENVLSNDKSVYCTEKNQCNIILRHWRDTPFAVTKLVIKTPDLGFTAPVQEGMIFISMSAEKLLSRTEKYRIRSSPPPPLPGSETVYPESRGYHAAAPVMASRRNRARVSYHDYLNAINNRPPSRRQANSPGARDVREHTGDSSEEEPLLPFGLSERDRPWHQTGGISQPSQTNISLPPPNVTTDCADPSDDDELPATGPILDDLQRRRLYGPDTLSSSDEVDIPSRRTRRLRTTPRKIDVVPNRDPYGNAIDPDILPPHASFFIEKKKNVVNVRFDPPVSGRFVLVKLWSPQDHDNIDIQNISVYGFAGPRFVPAVKMK